MGGHGGRRLIIAGLVAALLLTGLCWYLAGRSFYPREAPLLTYLLLLIGAAATIGAVVLAYIVFNMIFTALFVGAVTTYAAFLTGVADGG